MAGSCPEKSPRESYWGGSRVPSLPSSPAALTSPRNLPPPKGPKRFPKNLGSRRKWVSEDVLCRAKTGEATGRTKAKNERTNESLRKHWPRQAYLPQVPDLALLAAKIKVPVKPSDKRKLIGARRMASFREAADGPFTWKVTCLPHHHLAQSQRGQRQRRQQERGYLSFPLLLRAFLLMWQRCFYVWGKSAGRYKLDATEKVEIFQSWIFFWTIYLLYGKQQQGQRKWILWAVMVAKILILTNRKNRDMFPLNRWLDNMTILAIYEWTQTTYRRR